MTQGTAARSRRVLVSLASVVYLFTLLHAYREYLVPQFRYLGYTYRDIPVFWLIVASLLVAAIGYLVPPRIVRPSDFGVVVFLALVAVPSIGMAFAMGRLDYPSALSFSLLIWLCFAIIATLVGRRHRGLPIAESANGQRQVELGSDTRLPVIVLPRMTTGVFVTALVVIFCAGHAFLAATLGVSLRLPSISDVYDVREEYALQGQTSPLGRYLVPWLGNAIGPTLAVFGFSQKRFGLVALAIAGQASLYGQTGLKSILFALPAIALVAVVLRFWRQTYILMAAVVGVVVLAVLLDELLGGVVFSSLLVRRFMITPGALTALYHEFFSSNPFTWLSQSILGSVFDYPYSRSVPREVGAFWTPYAPSANANFLADGFSNFGVPGMLATALAVAILFRLYDNLAHGIGVVASSSLLVMPLITLANSAIQTSLLTHGVALLLLLVGVFPRRTKARLPNGERARVLDSGASHILTVPIGSQRTSTKESHG